MKMPDQTRDMRLDALRNWMRTESIGGETYSNDMDIEKVSDDASFRRYFRVRWGAVSVVLMDAPPEKEPIADFMKVASKLRTAGIHTPTIYCFDQDQGFIAMEDLGVHQFAQAIRASNADQDRAMALALDVLSQCRAVETQGLAVYGQGKLTEEMQLFPDWFLTQHLGLTLGNEFWELWSGLTRALVESALEQPQCFVHRDFHSRNLMMLDDVALGVLDFQDAVLGPATYDAVSLLRDCYIKYEDQALDLWFDQFVTRFEFETQSQFDRAEWRQWFDWMGLQRHLKCAGIFSRLAIRDHKLGYLADIPRVLDHLLTVGRRYSQFAGFLAWLEEHVQPRIQFEPRSR